MAGLDGPYPPIKQASMIFHPDGSVTPIPSILQSTTVDDAQLIAEAFAAIVNTYPVSKVVLGPWPYRTQSTVVVPRGGWLRGTGNTVILPQAGGSVSNSGAAVSCHPGVAGGATLIGRDGTIERITVDGIGVPSAAIATGIDVGDGYNITVKDAVIQNFTSTGATNSVGSNPLGAVGLSINNQQTQTEKLHVQRVTINNCGTPNATSSPNQGGGAAIQTARIGGTTTSRMYSDIDVTINSQPHQNGLVLASQGHLEQGSLRLRGNMNRDANPALCAAVVLGVANVGGGAAQQGHISNMELDICLESDPSSGTGNFQPFTFAFGTNADNTLGPCRGRLAFMFGNWQNAAGLLTGVSNNFQYSGRLFGDTSLRSAYAPYSALTSGTVYTNTSVDAMVTVAGGTVTAIVTNGVAQPASVTSGTFLIPAGGTIQVTFSGGTTLTWVGVLPA